MIEIKVEESNNVALLFQEYQWNYLPDAVLDGFIGTIWADDVKNPQVGVLGFPNVALYIIAGDPACPAGQDFLTDLDVNSALIFASNGWDVRLKEIFPWKLIRLPRYAFTSERLNFNILKEFTEQLPDGYELRPMDLSLAQKLAAEESGFSNDHFLLFDALENFIQSGFGFCILAGDEIVSVATTFAVCRRGIEIQINTRNAHQGKGLATAVASKLILQSLERGLDPNWDAANEKSVGLAGKLGYTPQGKYPMFVLTTRAMSLFSKVGLKLKEIFQP